MRDYNECFWQRNAGNDRYAQLCEVCGDELKENKELFLMNLEQIKQGILAKFEKSRLVFWQDEDKEFQEPFPEIAAELNL